jgi:nicotinamidase-related amidase
MKKRILITFLLLASAGSILAQDKTDSDSKRMRPALLVVDIQNAFLPMMPEEQKTDALRMINYMIALFREEGYPIVRVYHSDPLSGPKEGTEEFKFPSTTMIQPDDPMVIKHHGSGFKDTDLDKILKERKVNTVFICGLSAIACALATYMEAGDLGYDNFFVKYGLISMDPEHTKKIEEIYSALNYDTIRIMLQNALK